MRRGYRYARCPRGKRWNRRMRRCVLLHVPPVKLARGARKEAEEHPWASPAQARKIARDHLKENPRAYGAAETKAERALAFITDAIESGRTVYVSTSMRHTKITPATFHKFTASGRPLFKILADGDLGMSRGRTYDRITMGETLLVRITAE